MENQEEKMTKKETGYPSLKSYLLLPLIFFITVVVIVMFFVQDDFKDDLQPFVVWVYFGITFIYGIVSLIDLKRKDDKSNKLKTFIIIMSILSLIASIVFAICYVIL